MTRLHGSARWRPWSPRLRRRRHVPPTSCSRGGRVWPGKGLPRGDRHRRRGRARPGRRERRRRRGPGRAADPRRRPQGPPRGPRLQRRPRPLPRRRLRPALGRPARRARTRRTSPGASASTRRRCPRAPGSCRGTGTTSRGRAKALPDARQLIDAVTPDHPVFVSRLDGHMALANSPGPAPGRRDPRHEGSRTAAPSCATPRGEPTGILKDNAEDLVSPRHPRALARDEPARRAGGARARRPASASPPSRTTRRSTPCPPTRSCARAGELTARFYVWRYVAVPRAPEGDRRAHRPRRRLDPPGRPQDPLRRLDGLRHRGLLRAVHSTTRRPGACCSTRSRSWSD